MVVLPQQANSSNGPRKQVKSYGLHNSIHSGVFCTVDIPCLTSKNESAMPLTSPA